MKKWEWILLWGLVFSIVLGSFTSFAAVCKDIRSASLRLHVIANSNSAEDQALKLYVRDRILEETKGIFTTVGSKQEAEKAVDETLAQIQAVACAAVREKGYDYPVTVYRTNLYFATTRYETVTMPAGRYDALRVEIGTAKGKNWWCVLYPPLCVPAAEGEKAKDAAFSSKEKQIVEGGYEVRFAAVEWYEGAKEFLKEKWGTKE